MTPSVDIGGNMRCASCADTSSSGRPNVFAHPAWRANSSMRSWLEARRSEPTSRHPVSSPTSLPSDRYRSTEFIIIWVKLSEPRSWPTSPAEWNVDPLVTRDRSTRTVSVQPRRASQ